MRQQRPGDAPDAGIPRHRSRGQARQLAIEAVRQVALRRTGLFLDNVEIVQKPLAGGGDGGARLGRFRQQTEMGAERGIIFPQPPRQGRAGMSRRSHHLGLGKAPCVLLQPLKAEQFRTDGMGIAREFAFENHCQI